MAGILPEGTAGGLVIRDAAGAPINPPGVQNAYTPAPAFVSDCELTALPSDCTARIEPKQINAIVSELLAFAECLDPDGPWDCGSVTNLCSAFTAWIAAYESFDDDRYVNTTGDTMTGPLLLPPAAPTNPAEAANKQYVDTSIANAVAAAEGLDAAQFVDVVGDTMTGKLNMSYVNPEIALNKQTSGEFARIVGSMNGKLRWGARFGDETVETGAGNVGSDFKLRRYNDAGVAIDDALTFLRSSGLGLVKGPPTDPSGIATKDYVDTTTAAVAGAVVRTDIVQAFTDAAMLQARKNIAAAPAEMFGYYGMQVNGSAQIDQMQSAAIPLNAGAFAYFNDVWQAAGGSAGAVLNAVVAQIFLNGLPWAFEKSFKITATTKITTVAAADFASIGQSIEGQRLIRCGLGRGSTPFGQPITVAFWAYSDASGTASCSIRNAPVTRSHVKNFTLVAGVAKWVVLTFPPCNDGSWMTDNSSGMRIDFTFACGATLQTAPDTWANGNFLGTPANTNMLSVNGQAAYITGVMVLAGSQAPTAEQSPRALRQWQDELPIVQRYYSKLQVNNMIGYGHLRSGGTAFYMSIPIPVPTRTTSPSVGVPGDSKIFNGDNSALVSSAAFGLVRPDLPSLNGSGSCAASAGIHGGMCQLLSPTVAIQVDARLP